MLRLMHKFRKRCGVLYFFFKAGSDVGRFHLSEFSGCFLDHCNNILSSVLYIVHKTIPKHMQRVI